MTLDMRSLWNSAETKFIREIHFDVENGFVLRAIYAKVPSNKHQTVVASGFERNSNLCWIAVALIGVDRLRTQRVWYLGETLIPFHLPQIPNLIQNLSASFGTDLIRYLFHSRPDDSLAIANPRLPVFEIATMLNQIFERH